MRQGVDVPVTEVGEEMEKAMNGGLVRGKQLLLRGTYPHGLGPEGAT